MKIKTVQLFSDAYLESCKSMSPDAIAVFLEDFRLLYGNREVPTSSWEVADSDVKVDDI
jgi:hypothetical protein